MSLRLERNSLSKKAKASSKRSDLKRRAADLKRKAVVAVRLFLGVAALAVLAWGIYIIAEPSAENTVFQLQEIQFKGDQHLDTEQVKKMIRSTFPRNTLRIELDRLREFVEAETWVRSAAVRRQLPDKIQIHIRERQPTAMATIDDEMKVVDDEGVVLGTAGGGLEFVDRPIVKGLKNLAIENAQEENSRKMQRYLAVIKALDSGSDRYSGTISEILVGNPDKVAVVPTDQGVPVYLGSSDFRKHFEAYLSGIDYLMEIQNTQQIESIDVTYDNKIIVHTPQGDQAANTNNGD